MDQKAVSPALAAAAGTAYGAYQAAILDNYSGSLEGGTGLSVYLPDDGAALASEGYTAANYLFVQDTCWASFLTAFINTAPAAPDLAVSMSHPGSFSQGQSGTYTVTVSNVALVPTVGAVTVTDSLPAGLTPTAESGSGWTFNVAGNTVTATRSDALPAGTAYPAITLTVAVAGNAPASVTNTVRVSGGGETNTANDTASDPTTIIAVPLPNLTPYQPSNWSDKIVVSNQSGSYTDSNPLYSTDNLFVDWAVTNNGTASTAATFYTALYVDGNLVNSWPTLPPLAVGDYSSAAGYSIGSLGAGTHTLRIVADSTNAVNESDETDNSYTKTIAVRPFVPAVLNVGTTSLALPATTQGTAGAATSFTVGGSGLGSDDSVALTAPTGSEISLSGSSGFGKLNLALPRRQRHPFQHHGVRSDQRVGYGQRRRHACDHRRPRQQSGSGNRGQRRRTAGADDHLAHSGGHHLRCRPERHAA